MGRAERRKKERIDRIEARKDKILVSRDEISDMKHKVGEYKMEVLLTCFALANHRLWGHGATRIFRTLKTVEEMADAVLSGEVSMDDYICELKNEAGIIIRADGKSEKNEYA